MIIIEIEALANGAHRNQTCGEIEIPAGWAVIPEELTDVWEAAKPFVTVTAEGGVVTAMEAAEAPEPEDEPEPVDPLTQRFTDLEDAILELAAIIGGEEG